MIKSIPGKLIRNMLKGVIKENWLQLLILFVILIATLFLLHILFSKVAAIIGQVINAKLNNNNDSEVSRETNASPETVQSREKGRATA